MALNPNKISRSAAKHKVKFERDRKFARYDFLEFQGRKVPYQSAITKELFDLEVNQPSGAIANSEDQYSVIVLRKIHADSPEGLSLQQAQAKAVKEFSNEIMRAYNSYLLNRYPVRVNEKFFAQQ